MLSIVLGFMIRPAIEFIRPFLSLQNPVLATLFQNTITAVITILVMIFASFTLRIHRMCGCTFHRHRRRRQTRSHPLNDRLNTSSSYNLYSSESDNDSTTSEEKVSAKNDDDSVGLQNSSSRRKSSIHTPVTAVTAAVKWRNRVRSSSSKKIRRKRRWNSGMSSYAYV